MQAIILWPAVAPQVIAVASRPRLARPYSDEPALAYLPSRLRLIGLGNLGQAFAWLLALLPYNDPSQLQLVLQDFERIVPSHDSASLLSFIADFGRQKTANCQGLAGGAGFETVPDERRFGPWTRRGEDEPGAALWGVEAH